MVNRNLSTSRYVLAFIFTTLIFLFGILLGSYVSTKKISTLQTLEQDLRTQLLSSEIQSSLLAENICQFLDKDTLVDELASLSDRLTAMEDQLGKNHPDVLQLKRYYSLLEIQHWLHLKKLNAVCNTNYALILYFYSDDTNCPSCASQGYILSYLHEKYPQVRVYSFDVRIDDPAVITLKNLYGVREAPNLVINDKLYGRYMERDTIEPIIK